MSKLSPEALENLQELLAEATDAPDVYAKLPDGDYGCEIDSVVITTTKETQQPMLSWIFRVIDEETDYTNRLIFKNSVLNTVQNVKRAQKDLEKFNVDTSTIESIEEALPDLEGQIVIVQLTTARTGDSQWVNILVE